ncbi:MAG: ATP-binding cassette domain-containing protein [Ottowia sp.]|nr:ATP-binding cassette domain-containing protein [Ottowia sp.]
MLRSYPGNFTQYEALKAEQLAQEATIAQKADRLLAQEEAWMRQGVQARRTRSRDRILRLQQLRADRAARRGSVGQVRLEVDANVAGYQGKWLAQLQEASFSYGDKPIVKALDTVILRGDKVGIIGPNGAGKTTLLKLILGELEPTAGRVWRSRNLQVAYYDQMRSALEPQATLEEFVNPGSQWIEIGGRRQHVKSYLGDFLFSRARAASPVSSLSGGERARLLLARLFARPANVLVLDEPTNDLDIDTLDLLEELLQDYAGTVFVVSHDRRFLDNVVTSMLAWDGPGQWREYEGGIADWQAQGARWQALQEAQAGPEKKKAAAAPAATPSAPAPGKKKKLSYREQRELEGLPERIHALETEQNQIRTALSDGSLYKSDLEQALALQARDTEIEDKLMRALERWEELGG